MRSISKGVSSELKRVGESILMSWERPSHRQIIRALIILSKQVHSCERKLNILLQNSNVDLSKEDAQVLAMTEKVEEAKDELPPPEQLTPN